MEIWKDIEGWEGLYQVNCIGDVRSLGKTNQYGFSERVKLLKKRVHRQGYIRYAFSKGGVIYNKLAHRLVMDTFIGVGIGLDVNHINGIKDDNRIENLEWCTRSDNLKHSFHILGNRKLLVAKPKYKKGSENKQSVKIGQYSKEGEFIKEWLGIAEMKRQLGIIPNKCLSGKKKTAGGFIWKYL